MLIEGQSPTESFVIREAYVKPVVLQLQYSTEPDVAIAQACKTTGSATGPVISSCRSSVNPGACRGQGS